MLAAMASVLFRRVLPVLALVALGGTMAACSTDDASDAGVEQAVDAVVIDVRTPEEFADGHLDGAVNLSVEDGSLQQALGDLDPNASYVVYCRSGRRSAIAAEQMVAAGFTSVEDLGAIDAAAERTGLAIVTG
jgi:phage shock protein E